MPNKLNVTLTATTNPYLTDRLPLDGELEMIEVGTHSAIINAVFRIREEDGRLGAPVSAPDVVFTYDHATARDKP